MRFTLLILYRKTGVLWHILLLWAIISVKGCSYSAPAMKNINQTTIRRTYYHIRHNYITTNNIVVLIGLCIAASWAWGSVQAMERNYTLQKAVDYKQRELSLAKLEKDKLKYEQNYYNSDEYKELSAREKLGLVTPGEKVLVLPPNTVPPDEQHKQTFTPQAVEQSNMQQWLNFLSGAAFRNLQQ